MVDHCVDFLVPRLRPDNCLSALRSALDLGPHPGFTDAVLAYTASHLTDLIALAVGKGDDLHRPSTSYPATNTEPVTSRTNPVVVALAVLEPIHIQRVLTDPALKVPTETVVVNFVRLYLHARNTGGQVRGKTWEGTWAANQVRPRVYIERRTPSTCFSFGNLGCLRT